jgi:DNA-binding transcriptional LysR family regulator
MSEPLNLTHLRSLVAVVDRSSFTRAAQVLHLSQSTVSQHVRLLERRVGVDLFVREQRGVKLTPRGGEFVDRARGLLAEHDELVGDFAGAGSGRRRRRLSIGSTEYAADQVLPRLLGAFRETFPANDLSFMLQRSTALIESVRREDLDLAVTLAITPDAPGTRVGAVRLRWVADYVLEIPGGGTVLPLVAFEEPCAIRARACDLLGASGSVPSVVAQSASLDGVLSAVRAGLGLALLPIARDIPEGLRELHRLPSAGWIGVHLVSREGLADTITHTAASMLSSFLTTTTEMARTPMVPTRNLG